MANLHGLLAELGIEAPVMHPERAEPVNTQGGNGQAAKDRAEARAAWIVDRPFEPVQGNSYEIAYGAIAYGSPEGVSDETERRTVIKKVRIDGLSVHEWHDLETGAPLEQALHAYPVRGFRELGS